MSILLLLAAATAAPPPSEVAQEIVVIGRKMKIWKCGVSKVGGRMVCKTSKSSGDKPVDAINCGAMLSCLKPLEPRIDTLMGSSLPVGEKRRGFDTILTGVAPCMKAYSDAAVDRLARERAAP